MPRQSYSPELPVVSGPTSYILQCSDYWHLIYFRESSLTALSKLPLNLRRFTTTLGEFPSREMSSISPTLGKVPREGRIKAVGMVAMRGM